MLYTTSSTFHARGITFGEDCGEKIGGDPAPTKMEKISHTLPKILSYIFFFYFD